MKTTLFCAAAVTLATAQTPANVPMEFVVTDHRVEAGPKPGTLDYDLYNSVTNNQRKESYALGGSDKMIWLMDCASTSCFQITTFNNACQKWDGCVNQGVPFCNIIDGIMDGVEYAHFVAEEDKQGKTCNHWHLNSSATTFDFWTDASDGSPVYYAVYLADKDSHVDETYTNWSPGTPDADEFTIPDNCPNSTSTSPQKPLSGEQERALKEAQDKALNVASLRHEAARRLKELIK